MKDFSIDPQRRRRFDTGLPEHRFDFAKVEQVFRRALGQCGFSRDPNRMAHTNPDDSSCQLSLAIPLGEVAIRDLRHVFKALTNRVKVPKSPPIDLRCKGRPLGRLSFTELGDMMLLDVRQMEE